MVSGPNYAVVGCFLFPMGLGEFRCFFLRLNVVPYAK